MTQSVAYWRHSKLDIGMLRVLISYSNPLTFRFGRHVDSAQAYRNEVQVGLAIKKSGLERGELFISAYIFLLRV